MNKYYERAYALEEQLVKDRRTLHQNPEIGMELPNTRAYVRNRLEEIGLEVKEVGKMGLSAVIEGEKPGKTILLRADMDALPMKEMNELEYKATNNMAHTCGHDLHTAMLVNAAQILLENKADIHGRVKLMFQPGEEIFAGAKDMIEAGILENPKPDVAFAMHTGLNQGVGSFEYYKGHTSTSCDNFKITITGKGAHGAYPHTSIDPINAGVIIYQEFGELISREVSPLSVATLTFGMFSGGSNSNIIPEVVEMQGTLRTYDDEVREYVKGRITDMLAGIEKTTRVKIDFEIFASVPSLYNDPDLTEEIAEILETGNPAFKGYPDLRIMASEDMAVVSRHLPTTYIMLNCKVEGNNFSHHNPGVLFDEAALPIGAGSFATVAIEWLTKHSEQ